MFTVNDTPTTPLLDNSRKDDDDDDMGDDDEDDDDYDTEDKKTTTKVMTTNSGQDRINCSQRRIFCETKYHCRPYMGTKNTR